MSSLKAITLYGHGATPNPRKVAIILEELSIPYTMKEVDFSDIKKPPYTDICPNGRVPAIEDPNTGITLWESGAIVQYLVETYDKDRVLTYDTVPEKYQLNQWLMFQMSGQGPYFGQAAWFKVFHPEKLPSAQERYVREVERVTSVLDGWLQKRKFLVGDKLTYADLAFVPWAKNVLWLDDEKTIDMAKYPAYSKWLDGMLARESVKKILG
ncbi:glutathione S-transferase [Cladophialophora psammophila CBS 110553]|uniref:Glutathione S-transferase n=1 Tax=Cladophialophora psammophila CBS 110553 TaxID=1182543 RepID=W9X1G7_9EURO|nr:glutathione S-transferase [Cladophialophora psammophila CBS 110553]EXJ74312.1 glutathione S-transferase [Cladophialophora psammophila CBS 110553]